VLNGFDESFEGLTRKDRLVLACSGAVGLVAWWWAMASAPRYSVDGEGGSSLYWWALVAAAAIAGLVAPARAALVALALGGPGLALAGWTAPRGDNDGLWLLIFPMLAAWVLVLAVVAEVAGRLGRHLRHE